MNVLILGSGGREHALAAAIAKSPRLQTLFVAPGNPGCENIARRVAVSLSDHAAIVELCRQKRIDFVIVGPEARQLLELSTISPTQGVAAFGPSRVASRLEGSKGFTKDFCREVGIPTADYRRFRNREDALNYVARQGAPIVVKADGLASGKGVVVATALEEAEAAINTLYDADAEAECVVEAYLEGEEVSFFALCDGERAIAFGDAQDHKRVGDGDTGPNTGGMGAYSPSPLVTRQMSERIMSEIVNPTIQGMRKRGAPFRGILFAGLMITPSGPQLIEYNVRFGDPEAEVVLPRFRGDLLDWLWDASTGALAETPPPFSSEHALAVILAANGYPASPTKGGAVSGIEKAEAIEGVTVFQAGTRREGDVVVADGGRVLAVTGLGADLASARDRAYNAAKLIDFPTGFYRRDIGARALNSRA